MTTREMIGRSSCLVPTLEMEELNSTPVAALSYCSLDVVCVFLATGDVIIFFSKMQESCTSLH